MLKLLRETPMPLTRINFMNQARQTKFNLGGISIDFTKNGYQGSDLVTITRLTVDGYKLVTPKDWQNMLAWRTKKATTVTKHSNRKESQSRHSSDKEKRRNKDTRKSRTKNRRNRQGRRGRR